MGFSEDALCGGFDVVDETIQVLPGLDVGGDTSQVLPGLDVVDNTFPGADPEYGWFFAAAQGAKKNKDQKAQDAQARDLHRSRAAAMERHLYSQNRFHAYNASPNIPHGNEAVLDSGWGYDDVWRVHYRYERTYDKLWYIWWNELTDQEVAEDVAEPVGFRTGSTDSSYGGYERGQQRASATDGTDQARDTPYSHVLPVQQQANDLHTLSSTTHILRPFAGPARRCGMDMYSSRTLQQPPSPQHDMQPTATENNVV